MEKRELSLDILKIIATNFIMFAHYQQFTDTFFMNGINFFNGVFEFNQMVELFFLISGILAYNSMKKVNPGGGVHFWPFYLHKMLRLLPMTAIAYFAFQICIYGYYKLAHGQYWPMPYSHILSPWRLILEIGGLSTGWVFCHGAIFPTWYISTLLFCYCIYYFVEWASKKINGNVNVLLSIAILVGIAAWEYKWSIPFFNVWTGRGMYCFFWGVIFAKYFYYNQSFNLRTFEKAICFFMISGYALGYSKIASAYGNRYFLTFMIFSAILLLLKPLNYFQSRVISCLANVSYEVFVFHFAFIALWIDLSYVVDISIHSVNSMLLMTTSVWIVAFPLHYFCEPRLRQFVLNRVNICFGKGK